MKLNTLSCLFFVLSLLFLPGSTGYCKDNPPPAGTVKPASPAEAKIKALDSFLSEMHSTGKFNGTVLLAENGRVLFKKPYGFNSVKRKKHLTTVSSFNLASVSKQFTAMGIMLLAEEGKLNYDDKVNKFLPSLEYEGITIRHLLNHTSGLADYIELCIKAKWPPSKTFDNNDLLALFKSRKPALAFKPGEKYEYSNTGYVCLASIIERASGQPIHTFMAERIFKPLGMKNTDVVNLYYNRDLANRVFGFDGDKENDLINLDGVAGDGAVYSSVEDLFIWDQALYTEKLVSKATLKKAYSPGILNSGNKTGYGFGWSIDGNNVVSHDGSWVGFRSFIRRDMNQKSTFIILDNSSNNNKLMRTLFTIILGK
ncbi:MAG: beta-lactamase family protein [bacterium]|nr:beta-lactamase family protein [bacterium]